MNRPNPGAPVAIASLGVFLALTTYCAPLANMPTLAAALGAGPDERTWLLSSMSVGVAATLLTAGSVADNLGRRRVFVAGSLTLALGALLSGIATEPGLFLAGRLVSGAGSGAVIASSLGIIAHVSPTPAARVRASGVWGAALGAGGAVGPVLAGLLDEIDQWRSFYVATFLTGALVARLARTRVPESAAATRRPVDLLGAASLAGAVVLALVALTEGRSGLDPTILGLGALALVLLAAFAVVELRRVAPMIDLRLFRDRGFVAATVGAFGAGIGIVGILSFACTFLMTSLGMSSVHAALLLVAWSGTGTVSALAARRLPVVLRGRRQLALGLFAAAAGEAALWGRADGDGWGLLPGLLVIGLAYGVLNAALGQQATATVPAAQAAMGSGANNTARYIGSAIGVTLVVIVARDSNGVGALAAEAAWNHAVALSAGLTAAAGLAVALLSPASRRERRDLAVAAPMLREEAA